MGYMTSVKSCSFNRKSPPPRKETKEPPLVFLLITFLAMYVYSSFTSIFQSCMQSCILWFFPFWFSLLIEHNLQVDELNLAEIGPKFENHDVFPARTNTS
ncbi:hypothetical protein Dimus_016451 [Dionaea muscipula]